MTEQVRNEELMRYLDQELPPAERARVERALTGSTELQRELARYRILRAEIGSLREEIPVPGIWGAVNRRLTRPLGWILLVIAALLWSGWGAWVWVRSSADPIEKVAVGGVVVGFLLLLAATVVERWSEWQTDPYREIDR